jgi:alkyldihydroxyacetonephosphate synthase
VSGIVDQLRSALGESVVTDPKTLAAHCRDTWVLNELRDLEGDGFPVPLAVVEARSTEEVSCAMRLCREAGVVVVPYGGGSGVCGGIQVPENAVVISTAKLCGLVALDSKGLLATFRAGTNGMEAEKRVREDGLTIGHWPQSIEVSTVGGWVATRAAGQFSSGYGNIEDLVVDLEAVLPDGAVLRTRRTPRASSGPDLRQLFLGSEGTLGIVTEVTFSLRPLPEVSRGQAWHFESLAAGVEPIRRLMRAGYRPPVIRLYDASESGRHFPETCPEGRAMLILLHEGPAMLVAAEAEGVAEICLETGGIATDPSAVDHWLEKRNDVPGFREFLEKGIILDTIEVASTWDLVVPLYERVTESLSQVEGMLLATGHSSHSYRSGTNLYFTFVARPAERSRMADIYKESWKRTMDAVLELGAGISHHHGIGRVRRDALRGELGESGISVLRSVKRALDPNGLLNPGVLLREEDRS